MKFRYDKEDDILMIWLSKKKVDYAKQSKDMIVHFSENSEAVLIEILQASKFLKRTSKVLPQDLKKQFLAA